MCSHSKVTDHKDLGFGPGGSDVVDLPQGWANISDQAIVLEPEVRCGELAV